MACDLDRVLRRLFEAVTTHKPALVFAASFRSLMFAGATEGNPHNRLQQFVQQFGMLMTSWQATTFLIGEYFSDIDDKLVFTVADGLIWSRQSVQCNSMVRRIEIMKMRGQPTLPATRQQAAPRMASTNGPGPRRPNWLLDDRGTNCHVRLRTDAHRFP